MASGHRRMERERDEAAAVRITPVLRATNHHPAHGVRRVAPQRIGVSVTGCLDVQSRAQLIQIVGGWVCTNAIQTIWMAAWILVGVIRWWQCT